MNSSSSTPTGGIHSSLQAAKSRNILVLLLNNRPLKSKIAIIVIPLILIALYGMGLELWSANKRYMRAQELERANQASDYILKAAGLQAKERGFTASVLSNPQDQTTLKAIADLRTRGDKYMDSALVHIREAAVQKSVVAENLRNVEAAREKRNAFRASNDKYLGTSSPEAAFIKQWIGVQSALIMAEQRAAASMFLGENRLETILALNSSIKNSVFYAGEFAGRERANIGTAIGSGKPIDAERLASLMQFRGIVQEHCESIIAFSLNPAVTPAIKNSIEEMQRVFLTEFEETRKNVYKASTDSVGKAAATYPLTTTEWIQRSTKAINSILNVSDAVSAEVARLAAEERQISFYTVVAEGAMMLVLVLIIILSNRLGSLIANRILHLRNEAQRVEQGDLSVQTDDAQHDEIGDLSHSFNNMITTLRNSLQELAAEKAGVENKVDEAIREIREGREYLQTSAAEMLAAVEQFSRGDLTQRLTPKRQDDIGQLFEGYNRALDNVCRMMLKIIEESEITASASTQITTSIEHMTQGIQRQQQQSSYIAVASEQMAKTIEESARNTALVAQQSQEASKEAMQGGITLQQMTAAMTSVSTIVRHSAEDVEHLSLSSEQISDMADAIADIADQTNLLALNAAIEAARAGEQGRGFAVVADEVRKLAERTQKATKEISGLVRTIKNDTHNVTMTMANGVREVENAQALVGATSDTLGRIIKRTQEISAIIMQLAGASEEQYATSAEIATNMDTMTMVIAQSAAVSEEISQTSESLNQMTLAVQRLIQEFTVDAPASDNTVVAVDSKSEVLMPIQSHKRMLAQQTSALLASLG
ncbi:MAG: HAMP domain-containing protein [Ignavibacteria bacterium]|nr:HAMP domain-containing protein [Ignavibacteria bacterium]